MKKLGILGGGQLARMMLPICNDWDIDVSILDKKGAVAHEFSAGAIEGDFRSQEDIVAAFKDCDYATIDLEAVSIEGLEALEEKGVSVSPSSSVLKVIQNKYLQKQFFTANDIPTSAYRFVDKVDSSLDEGFLKVPVGGYDGKGVVAWKGDLSAIPDAFKDEVMWEERVDMEMEISVIVARGLSGETKTYLPTEMGFDPKLNLISYTFYPARIEHGQSLAARRLAEQVVEKLGVVGVMAVEMFIDKEGKILVNELAPRPHNSGHHTIESCESSQFENHLRGVLGLPLGSVDRKRSETFALTFNVIGEGREGASQWEGVSELLAEPQAYVHNYGKRDCREGRKMGHITLIDSDEKKIIERYEKWSKIIKVRGV